MLIYAIQINKPKNDAKMNEKERKKTRSTEDKQRTEFH